MTILKRVLILYISMKVLRRSSYEGGPDFRRVLHHLTSRCLHRDRDRIRTDPLQDPPIQQASVGREGESIQEFSPDHDYLRLRLLPPVVVSSPVQHVVILSNPRPSLLSFRRRRSQSRRRVQQHRVHDHTETVHSSCTGQANWCFSWNLMH